MCCLIHCAVVRQSGAFVCANHTLDTVGLRYRGGGLTWRAEQIGEKNERTSRRAVTPLLSSPSGPHLIRLGMDEESHDAGGNAVRCINVP